MHCICCDSILAPATIYRSILVPHPTLPNKTTTLRVEETMCNRCATKSKPNYNSEETADLSELGLDLPEEINYDY